MSRAATDQASAEEIERGSRLGGRIASALYWALLVWVAVASLHSLVGQVFWPSTATSQPASVDCRTGLEVLREDLLWEAGRVVSTGAGLDRSTGNWFAAWDARHTAVASNCSGAGRTASHVLAQLRYRLEATLRRYDGTEVQLNHRLETILRAGQHAEQNQETPP